MSVVWKYALEPMRPINVEMPVDARIVHVGENPGARYRPAIWALVYDKDAPKVRRRFYAAATGEDAPEDAAFVGSAICGPYAWHVFERVDTAQQSRPASPERTEAP